MYIFQIFTGQYAYKSLSTKQVNNNNKNENNGHYDMFKLFLSLYV